MPGLWGIQFGKHWSKGLFCCVIVIVKSNTIEADVHKFRHIRKAQNRWSAFEPTESSEAFLQMLLNIISQVKTATPRFEQQLTLCQTTLATVLAKQFPVVSLTVDIVCWTL